MKSVWISMLAISMFVSFPIQSATAQPGGIMSVIASRICIYLDGTEIELPLDHQCPPFWISPNNILVGETFRMKPLELEVFDIPEPILVEGMQFLAPPDLINEAQQQGLPGVFVLPPFPTPWQMQLIGPGDGLQALAPQPLLVDPGVPTPLFDPGSEPFFVVDSFFDVAFDLTVQVDLLGIDLQPIPVDLQINVVPDPVAPLEVNVCRLCIYADGSTLEIGLDDICPPFIGFPANVLVGEGVRLKTWNIIVPEIPDGLLVGGVMLVGPNDLIDVANQLGQPIFLPPPFPVGWEIQILGDGEGMLALPQDPIPLLPGQPIPLFDPGSLPFEPAFFIDSFFDIATQHDVHMILLDENLNPLPINVGLAPFEFGDANMDGSVNLLDVAPFIQLLTNGEYKLQADMNRDGVVNLLDVAGFIDALNDD